MTPIQVIMLAYRVRQAQKAVQASLNGDTPLMDLYHVMADLEDQLDAALEIYASHQRALELQEQGHGN